MPESRVSRKERESLRQAIEAKEQIRQIARTIQALESGLEQVRIDGVIVERPVDKTRVAALTSALNGRFKLLAKVMPDLKALEMDLGESTLGAVREFTQLERAARLSFLLERLGASGPGQDTVGGDAHLDTSAGSAERCPSFLS